MCKSGRWLATIGEWPSHRSDSYGKPKGSSSILRDPLAEVLIHTVDGQNPAPPKRPWNYAFSVNSNQQMVFHSFKLVQEFVPQYGHQENPLKIDILKQVGTAYLVMKPGATWMQKFAARKTITDRSGRMQRWVPRVKSRCPSVTMVKHGGWAMCCSKGIPRGAPRNLQLDQLASM